MKKYLSGLITGILVSLSITVFATELNIISNPYPVQINGIETNVDGYNINDSTYLKLKDFEKAGLNVDFKNNTILIESAIKKIENDGDNMDTSEVKINNSDIHIYVVNGEEYLKGKDISKKYNDYNFSIGQNDNGEKILNFTDNNQKILIKNVPFIIISGSVSITNQYFENNILPLIK